MNRGYGYRMSFGPTVTPAIIKKLMIANVAVFVAQVLIPNLTPACVVSPEQVWLQRQISGARSRTCGSTISVSYRYTWR